LRPGVRDHYLTWLRRAHPALAPAAERRYRSAYGPRAERDALAARVRAMVRAHGGPEPGGATPFARRARRAAVPPTAQLRLV
jgi:hypothetical protein